MRRRTMLLGIAIVLIVIIGIFVTNVSWKQRVVLKVLCAGSLTLPFEEIKAKFEADHESFTRTVEVQLEPGGSVGRVQAVTEIGEECDVLASADYTLIPNMMIPEYTDWYIVHAENSMSLAYTSNSKYADEFNADNWYQILRRSDVKWGFSNPNLDPCGYRSPMVIQLAELEYGDDMIFEDLIEANSDITVSESDGIYMIDTNMSDLNPNTSRLTIRDKSVDLVALVQSGGLDYAFEYSSVSKQHGLRYIDLPASIDLSSDGYRDLYSKVKVRKTTTVSTGKPIVYGVTIPDNAPNKELAEEWIKYMINEYGQGVFTDNGQRPIAPALVNDINKVPESLRSYVTEIE